MSKSRKTEVYHSQVSFLTLTHPLWHLVWILAQTKWSVIECPSHWRRWRLILAKVCLLYNKSLMDRFHNVKHKNISILVLWTGFSLWKSERNQMIFLTTQHSSPRLCQDTQTYACVLNCINPFTPYVARSKRTTKSVKFSITLNRKNTEKWYFIV